MKLLPNGAYSTALPERMAASLATQSASEEPIQRRPRIGLLSTSGNLRDGGWPIYAGDAACAHAVFEAGGLPVIIPTLPLRHGYDPYNILVDHGAFEELFAVMWPLMCSLDGLLLAGGGDLYACLYGQAVHPQAGTPEGWRDVWERYVTLMAWGLCMPTFGICRGMQVMNVVRGGGLFQDARAPWSKQMPPPVSHRARGRISADNWVEHPVIIQPNSRLAQILDAREERVPYQQSLDAVLSMHHQFIGYLTRQGEIVGYLAPGLVVGAIAPDGVIEAIEDPDLRRFWLAVQFHPEWVVSLSWALRLFTALIDASKVYAACVRDESGIADEIRTWLRMWDRLLLQLSVEPGPSSVPAGAELQAAPFFQMNGKKASRR